MQNQRYRRDEIVRRGQDMYDRRIRTQVEGVHDGKFLVVDIETGHFEVDTSELAALRRAREHKPDAALYLVRVGFPTAYRIGSSLPVEGS